LILARIRWWMRRNLFEARRDADPSISSCSFHCTATART
jgi:hypothetical protein